MPNEGIAARRRLFLPSAITRDAYSLAILLSPLIPVMNCCGLRVIADEESAEGEKKYDRESAPEGFSATAGETCPI
jgi:hypothetical protein